MLQLKQAQDVGAQRQVPVQSSVKSEVSKPI